MKPIIDKDTLINSQVLGSDVGDLIKRHRGRLLLISVALGFNSLQAMEAWRLREYGDLPAYPLLLGLLRVSTVVPVNEVAGICRFLLLFWGSVFQSWALVAPVASRHAVLPEIVIP